jgi:hypothetical protein
MPVGVTQVEREGVWHLLDWVGAMHYPNVADFIEEARRFGISRRVSSALDFHKLTTDSRLILIHPRGWIRDAEAYYLAIPFLHRSGNPYGQGRSGNPYGQGGAHTCPKGWPTHNRISDPPPMCAQLWWQDVDGGVPTLHPDFSERRVVRTMPSFAYTAFAPPPKVDRKWTPAIFGSFPITRLVVVRDHAGNTDAKNLARAKAAKGIPTAVEEE